MSEERRRELILKVSDDVEEKVKALAERRYGDRGPESISHIVEDILTWKLDSWDRYDISLGDWFWLQLAHRAPISRLRDISWGKLIEGYFD